MKIRNLTQYVMSSALKEAVMEYPTDGLVVELKYCPKNSRRYISGTYYRRARNYEDGKYIRLRINRNNKYPLEVNFKTSQYYEKPNAHGEMERYQKLRTVRFDNPHDLILAVFLHEFSHYMDHMEGIKGTYKQTKADKFALSILDKLEII